MAYVIEEWDTFDTWCLGRGIDIDTITGRRLVNLAVARLTEGLDAERTKSFLDDAERIGNQLLEQRAEEAPIPDAAPPPGWKSDEENWRNIQATLGQMATIDKAVNRAG